MRSHTPEYMKHMAKQLEVFNAVLTGLGSTRVAYFPKRDVFQILHAGLVQRELIENAWMTKLVWSINESEPAFLDAWVQKAKSEIVSFMGSNKDQVGAILQALDASHKVPTRMNEHISDLTPQAQWHVSQLITACVSSGDGATVPSMLQ